MSDHSTLLTIAAGVTRLQDLDNLIDVAAWVSSVHAALDVLGLADFLAQGKKLPPQGPEVTLEEIQQWNKERTQAVYILKTSLVDVWKKILDRRLIAPMEQNPRLIFLIATSGVEGYAWHPVYTSDCWREQAPGV